MSRVINIFQTLLPLLAIVIPPQPGLALTLVIEPKDRDMITRYEISHKADVGATTINALRELQIPYQGSETGIASINGLGSDLEVVSDTKMKAWGWCFAIDGKKSDKMPNQSPMPSDAKILKWFYAYALYDQGSWGGYCLQD